MLEQHAPVLLPDPASRGVGGAVFAALCIALAGMACLKYLALHSTVVDLGVFLSDIHSMRGFGQWWRAFAGHAQPLMFLYARICRLVPDQAAPLALLALQALALSLPALWAARRHGMLAALAYALYFPVWTNALNGFRLDHLLVPILFAFLAAATSGRFGLAFVLGLLPALVKEPYALTTACCGLYLWIVARQTRAGAGLIAFGALYFYVATAWIIPFCTADPSLGAGSGGYSWLGDTPGAALAALFSRPGEIMAAVLKVPGKWTYLAFLFGALLFFPLFRPRLLLPALPALALSLLASRPEAHGLSTPYSAGAIGVLFFAFCEVLGPVRILARQSGAGGRGFGLVLASALGLFHVLLAPSPVSRVFLTTNDFAHSAEAYEPTARDAAILAAILKTVPEDARVPVAAQNTLNWGALAERRDFDSFPMGVFEAHPVRDLSGATWKDFWAFVRTRDASALPLRTWRAEYVLLDLTRPWYVGDRGCGFENGSCRDAAVAAAFEALVARARGELETVHEQDGFLILRRPVPAVPAPAVAPAAEPAAAGDAATQPPGAQVPPSPPNAPVNAPAVQAPSTPSASAPSVAPPSGDQDLGSEIEVEVLDRFPTQRRGKKAKMEALPPAGEQPAQPDAAPPAGDAAVSSGTTPAPEAGGQPARPPRRRKAASERAPQPFQPGDAAPSVAPAPDAGPVVAPEAAPASESTRRTTRHGRRHKEPAEIPAPQQAAPGGDSAPAP